MDQLPDHPLRAWRKLLDLNQDEAAARIGTTKPTISRIETGKRNPSFALASRISARTGIPIDKFATREAS